MSAPSTPPVLGRRGFTGLAGTAFLSVMRQGQAEEAPGRARTLTVAIPTDPVGIEPGANQAESVGSEIILNIFDTLVAWARDTDAEPAPRLAASWEVAEEGRLYRFRLRPGVLFHDGTPCDAAAVRF